MEAGAREGGYVPGLQPALHRGNVTAAAGLHLRPPSLEGDATVLGPAATIAGLPALPRRGSSTEYLCGRKFGFTVYSKYIM